MTAELIEMAQYYGKVEHRNTFINSNLPSADDLLTNNWVREGTGLVFHFILLQGQLLSGHWSCCIDKYPPRCRAWSPGSECTITVNGESVIGLDERLQAIAAEARGAVKPS